jgi:hydroxysqualene dehydroxylase
MQRVLVIGGGLSGLSSAVHLTKNNIPVLLIESANRLGGRVSSFYDKQFGEVIDNGQHIMMGCYNETLNYLKIINAERNFYFQKDLEVVFYYNRKKYSLSTGRGVYPLNLLKGILSFDLLKMKDRISLVKFFINLPVSSTRDIRNSSAEEWLIESNQSEELINTFWNTFVIGALNTSPANASALMLRSVLLRVFFSGRNASSIIIPDKPLSEAFCNPASDYLRRNNSEVVCSERVIKFIADRKNNISSVVTNKRIIENFSHVISAVPLYVLKKLLSFDPAEEFYPVYSPIITIHFKSDRDLFPEKFVAVTGSHIHWIFKHPAHYSIVISSAEEYAGMDNKAISEMIINELRKEFIIHHSDITAIKIIKEKRATFLPSKDILDTRPKPLTQYNNLILAGDWTNTGLPSTIEGAILSGRLAVQHIMQ